MHTASAELSYLVGREIDRNAAAQRPQLHRPGAAAARRAALSVARRRLGRRPRHGDERQRSGLSRSNVYLLDGTLQNDFTNGPGRQRRRHGARHGDHPRIPRRVKRLQRRVRPQLRRPNQRADQVGHQPDRPDRVYEFHRNDALDPANYFDTAASPISRRNQFGGGIRRTAAARSPFYFVGYEGLRESLGKTITSFVPDNDARAGRLPDGPVAINAAVQPYLNGFPVANGAAIGSGLAPYTFGFQQKLDEHFGQGRLDYNIGAAHQLFARYTLDDGDQRLPTDYPQFPRSFLSRNQFFTGEYRNILSDRTPADHAPRLQPHADRPERRGRRWTRRCRSSCPDAAWSATSTSAACSDSVRRARRICGWCRTSSACSTT